MSILQKLTEGVVSRDMRKEGAALLNKWEKTGLLEGLRSETDKNNMSLILENQAKQLVVEQSSVGGATGTALASPMQGTVVKIAVHEGAQVEVGDLIIVLEAMKMEQPLNAHKSGIVTNLKVAIGETVASATVLCDIIDA